MSKAGTLDRRIVIQQVSTSQDANGVPVETWSTYTTVWARRMSQSPRELFARFDQRVAEDTVLWEIRYTTGITDRMRVSYAGIAYDIKGVQEIGRRKGLILLTKVSQ